MAGAAAVSLARVLAEGTTRMASERAAAIDNKGDMAVSSR
jgi:hypothetical protein